MYPKIKMSFRLEVAKKLGVNAAILLENIEFWCYKNQSNQKHFHNGTYWTYNSVKAFAAMFEWLTPRQIQLNLDKLESEGYLLSGNFNKVGYDRTKWYSAILQEQQIHLTNTLNGNNNNVEPIPDNKHRYINTDIRENTQKQEIHLIKEDRGTGEGTGKLYSSLKDIDSIVISGVAAKYNVPVAFVESCFDSMVNWLEANGKTKKNYLAMLRNWVKSDAVKFINQNQKDNFYANTKRGINGEQAIRELKERIERQRSGNGEMAVAVR